MALIRLNYLGMLEKAVLEQKQAFDSLKAAGTEFDLTKNGTRSTRRLSL